MKSAVLMPGRPMRAMRLFVERIVTGKHRRSTQKLFSHGKAGAKDGRLQKSRTSTHQIGERATISAFGSIQSVDELTHFRYGRVTPCMVNCEKAVSMKLQAL